MGEDKKSNRFLIRLAEIADLTQKTFKGKSSIVFELNQDEYQKALDQIENVDWFSEQFKVDISGTDFIFLLQKSSTDDKGLSE